MVSEFQIRWGSSIVLDFFCFSKKDIVTLLQRNLGNYPCDPFSSVTKVKRPGPGCSKLTTSLVNFSLNFQKLISQICQYFLLKKCEEFLQFSHFFQQKISMYLVIRSLNT